MIGNGNIKLDYLDSALASQLNEVRNHPDIMRWCRQHTLIDDHNQKIWFEDQSEDPSIQMFVIRTQKKEDWWDSVGVCGLTDIDLIHRRAEFSCYTFPEQRLKGYCKKALELLFDHGFNAFNLNLIWGETFRDNPAYDMFKTHLGMKYDGTRRKFYFKNGEYIDAHMLSITAEEWRNRHVE